jgi:hypothetical protein
VPTDDQIGSVMQKIMQESDVVRCLKSVYLEGMLTGPKLQQMRANLFRAEHLIATQPRLSRDFLIWLPHDVPISLETLKAAQRCLEEWMESQTYQAILAQHPT